jgi:rod shape-determining protein MreC
MRIFPRTAHSFLLEWLHMEFVTRFKNALFLIAVLLAQALALAVQVREPANPAEPDGEKVRLIRIWAMDAVTPFERGAHGISSGVRHTWYNYIDLRHARQENEALKNQVARMRLDEAAIAEDALEGRRLQALLAFRQRYVGGTVAAQVIGTSATDQSHILTIDKGSKDGLRPDMPVITPDGIVGKLRDVTSTTAQVVEINDQTSGAGVILETTRIRGILRGTVTGRVQIGNLTADSRIKPGEKVLTSGGDQVYPRGLPVGVIESIAPDPDHQPYMAISIKPAADLNRIEEVLVITSIQPDLTQAAQQDLVDAQQLRAAQISAEKLPGLHDDQANDSSASPAAPGAPASPPVKVPKPLPADHPDRYSSGYTPPAADLTPGARNTTLPDQPVTPAPKPLKPKPTDTTNPQETQ